MRVVYRRPIENSTLKEVAQLRTDNGSLVTALFRDDEGWYVSIPGAGHPSSMKIDLDHYSMRWLKEMLCGS